jgi:hypothetical protein
LIRFTNLISLFRPKPVRHPPYHPTAPGYYHRQSHYFLGIPHL